MIVIVILPTFFCVLALFDLLKNRLHASSSFPRVFSAFAALLCGAAGLLSGRMLLPLAASMTLPSP